MGEGPGGAIRGGGGSRRGNLGEVGWGGYMPPRPSVGPSQAPLTSLCPPSNHLITLNLTLTFAASWFSHASHAVWAEQDLPNFICGCFLPHHCSPFWTPILPLTLACWLEAPGGGGG